MDRPLIDPIQITLAWRGQATQINIEEGEKFDNPERFTPWIQKAMEILKEKVSQYEDYRALKNKQLEINASHQDPLQTP